MERMTFAKIPSISMEALPLSPMHAWPTPVKQFVLGVCIMLCIIAYVVMAAGFVGLATLVLGLL